MRVIEGAKRLQLEAAAALTRSDQGLLDLKRHLDLLGTCAREPELSDSESREARQIESAG